jgi:hypothetical protein
MLCARASCEQLLKNMAQTLSRDFQLEKELVEQNQLYNNRATSQRGSDTPALLPGYNSAQQSYHQGPGVAGANVNDYNSAMYSNGGSSRGGASEIAMTEVAAGDKTVSTSTRSNVGTESVSARHWLN